MWFLWINSTQLNSCCLNNRISLNEGISLMDKEYTAEINGETVVFDFKDSLIHAEGNAVGNIDAIITTKPTLPQNLLLDELHIKIPGSHEFLYIYGYGVVENTLKATFNSSSIVDSENLPEAVEVYWGANGEQLIGEMNCRAFSEKVEAELSEELEEESFPEESNTEKDKAENKDEKKQTDETIEQTESTSSNNKPIMFIAIFIIIILILYFSF